MANIVTGNFVPNFHAAQGVLKYDSAAVTFSESAALDTFYASTSTVAQLIAVKNISITPPKGDTTIVPLLGVEAVTVGAAVPMSGTFQNAIYDEKSFSDAVLTCTMVLTGDPTNLPDFIQLACGSGQAIGATYKRYSFGSSDSSETRNLVGSILLNCDNGYEEFNIVMNNPIVNVGDIKPTSMEGHFEIDFEARCLPKNFVMEGKV